MLTVMVRFGVLMAEALASTGLPSQYLRPSQRRIVATFWCVTTGGATETISSRVGGCGPARYTAEKKPERCSAMESCRLNLQFLTDVMPRRALEAFCRCEHMCATLRMEGMVGEYLGPEGSLDGERGDRGERSLVVGKSLFPSKSGTIVR